MITKEKYEISDPSDWKNSKLPDLEAFDSLQRCYICKDFIKAPVITSCNHSFCSHCIREYLMSHDHCPLCKAEQFESNLKRVILLEEIIICYSKIRPALLELLRGKDEYKNEEKTKVGATEVPDTNACSISDNEEVKGSTIMLPDETSGAGIRENSDKLFPRRTELVECPICSEFMSAEELQTSHIDLCLSGKSSSAKSRSKSTLEYSKKRKKPNTRKPQISSFFKSEKEHNTDLFHSYPERQEKVEKIAPISSPMDTSNFYFNGADKHHRDDLKRLPKLDYSSLSTPKLKEKLAALLLSTNGSRVQLEHRYNHYYILYNSNLDSSHPVEDKVLRHQQLVWERSHQAFNNPRAPSLFGLSESGLNSITDKSFSKKQWLNTNKENYKDLIEQAKANRRLSATKNTPKIEPTSSASDDISYKSQRSSEYIQIDSDNATSTSDAQDSKLIKTDQSGPHTSIPSSCSIDENNDISQANVTTNSALSNSDTELTSFDFRTEIANSSLFSTEGSNSISRE